jgi:hypothetical protein
MQHQKNIFYARATQDGYTGKYYGHAQRTERYTKPNSNELRLKKHGPAKIAIPKPAKYQNYSKEDSKEFCYHDGVRSKKFPQ